MTQKKIWQLNLYQLEQKNYRMRQREFDTQKAIHNAMEVFWSRSYKGVSMKDLLTAMGIGKGCFYAAFGSKRELYLLALRHYRVSKMLIKQSNRTPGPTSADESLRKLFGQLIDRTINQHKTCMLGKAALEFRGSDSAVAEIVDVGVSQLEETILKIILYGQGTGEIPKDRNPHTLSRFITANLYGIQVWGRAKLCRENLEEIAATTLSVVMPNKH